MSDEQLSAEIKRWLEEYDKGIWRDIRRSVLTMFWLGILIGATLAITLQILTETVAPESTKYVPLLLGVIILLKYISLREKRND